jgi:hypothetical protein
MNVEDLFRGAGFNINDIFGGGGGGRGFPGGGFGFGGEVDNTGQDLEV